MSLIVGEAHALQAGHCHVCKKPGMLAAFAAMHVLKLHSALAQLVELSQLDSEREIFGAGKHQYRSVPVAEAELQRVETVLGVSLPTEYRDFLLQVGSGAGPYYGVWAPDQALLDFRDLVQCYEAEERKYVRAADPFPLTAEDVRGIEIRLAARVAEPLVETAWPCNGCLPICGQGCTFCSVLVLVGEYAGRVFDLNDLGACRGEWIPARRPPGLTRLGVGRSELPRLPSPPTFGEWFAGWVERCRVDLSAAATPWGSLTVD